MVNTYIAIDNDKVEFRKSISTFSISELKARKAVLDTLEHLTVEQQKEIFKCIAQKRTVQSELERINKLISRCESAVSDLKVVEK